MRAVEAVLGRPLPALLRRLYLEVADGGFGPGTGLPPFAELKEWAARQAEGGPLDLLLLCDWGCGILSFVELDPPHRIWGVDPNESEDLRPGELALGEWLERWLACDLRGVP